MNHHDAVARLIDLERGINSMITMAPERNVELFLALEEALTLARSVGDQRLAAYLELATGVPTYFDSGPGAALPILEDADIRLERLDMVNSHVLMAYGSALVRAGQFERAAVAFEKAVEHSEAVGDWAGAAWARYFHASQLFGLKRPLEAESVALLGLLQAELVGLPDLWRELRALYGEAATKQGRSASYTMRASPTDGLKALEASLDLTMHAFNEGDNERGRWVLSNVLGRLDAISFLPGTSMDFRYLFGDLSLSSGAVAQATAIVDGALAIIEQHGSSRQSWLLRRSQFLALRLRILSVSGIGATEESIRVRSDCEATLLRIRDPRRRAKTRLNLAKSKPNAESALDCLALARDIADDPRLIDTRCEALLIAAMSSDSPQDQLRILDVLDNLLPQLAEAYRKGPPGQQGFLARSGARSFLKQDPDFFQNIVAKIAATANAMRFSALWEIDSTAALEFADRTKIDLSVAGEMTAMAQLALDFTCDSPRALASARRAATFVAGLVEGAAALGNRAEVVAAYQEELAMAMVVLAVSDELDDWALALELADATGRGNLRALIGRGQRAGIPMGDMARLSPSEAVHHAAQHLGAGSDRRRVDLSLFEHTLGCAFCVVKHDSGRELLGFRFDVSNTGIGMTEFAVRGPALQLLEQPSTWRRKQKGMAPNHPDWTELSKALTVGLPKALGQRDVIAVSAPDPLFATLPWSALVVDEALLIERAAVFVTPALSLLRPAIDAQQPADGLMYAASNLSEQEFPLERERQAFREQARWRPHPVTSGAEFRTALSQPDRYGFAYVAAHGGGAGQETFIELEDGSRFEVRDAIAANWASIVILNCCQSANQTAPLGADPVGLPLAMLLRGADCVIGCSIDIGATSASHIGGDIIRSIAAGQPPVYAVAQAQRSHLNNGRPMNTPIFYWAPLIPVTFEVPR